MATKHTHPKFTQDSEKKLCKSGNLKHEKLNEKIEKRKKIYIQNGNSNRFVRVIVIIF